MKILSHPSNLASRSRSGFTVAEIVTALGVFSLLVVGTVYAHLFGLRMFNMTATKLSASQNARSVLSRVDNEIRSGKLMYVGTGSATSFTNVADNAPQQGNALQIFPTTDTNSFIIYYLDPVDQQLKRSVNGSAQTEVLASYVTNQVVFHAEDCLGNTLTNDQNNRTIRMTLEFYQWEFPVAQVVAGGYYDYWRLQTRITRRTID